MSDLESELCKAEGILQRVKTYLDEIKEIDQDVIRGTIKHHAPYSYMESESFEIRTHLDELLQERDRLEDTISCVQYILGELNE